MLAGCPGGPAPGPPPSSEAAPANPAADAAALFERGGAPLAPPTSPALAAGERDTEPNDTWGEADPLEAGVAAQGVLDPPKDPKSGDEDWYLVVVPGPASVLLRAEVTGAEDVDLVLEWMEPGKREPKTLVQADAQEGKPGGELLGALRAKPGTQYFRVREARYRGRPRKGSQRPYQLLVTATEDRPEAEAEPDDHPAHATPLALAGLGQGTLGHVRDKDVWRVQIPEEARGKRLRVDLSGLPGLATKGNVAWEPGSDPVTHGASKAGEALHFRNLMPPGGTMAVLVTLAAGRGAAPTDFYTVSVRAEDAVTGLTETEPNHAAEAPTVLPSGGRVVGFIDHAGDLDRYRFEVKTTAALQATLEPPLEGRLSLELLGPDGQGAGRSAGAEPGQAEVLRGFGVAPGSWQLLVRGRDGFSDPIHAYALSFELGAPGRAELEPNDTLTAAGVILLVPGQPQQGWIHTKGDQDWWRVDLPVLDAAGAPAGEGRIVTLRLAPPAGLAMGASLVAPGGEVLVRLEPTAREATFTHFLSPGAYHVLVTPQDPARFEPGVPYELELLPGP